MTTETASGVIRCTLTLELPGDPSDGQTTTHIISVSPELLDQPGLGLHVASVLSESVETLLTERSRDFSIRDLVGDPPPIPMDRDRYLHIRALREMHG